MKIDNIIIRPVLTEKATNLTKGKTYMFEVSVKANKHQVKTALERLYDVSVAAVRLMIRKGKERRVGRRMKPKIASDTKIAFVTVKKGIIDLFPQT